ncbi:MAG: hypothetical protein LBE84_00350 [Planctomycetota bacterium]|nr:hypothetical protein [Planctomycetota bacterium]
MPGHDGNKRGRISQKKKTVLSASRLDAKIAAVRACVAADIVGQSEAAGNLLVAFKRPFVTGFQEDVPTGTIFITGGRDVGRHTLLRCTAAAALPMPSAMS